jgi:hypothetical protein
MELIEPSALLEKNPMVFPNCSHFKAELFHAKLITYMQQLIVSFGMERHFKKRILMTPVMPDGADKPQLGYLMAYDHENANLYLTTFHEN